MANAIISANDFQARLKKSPCGIFLFFGEEEYLKQHYLNAARNAVLSDPSLAAFNHLRLMGEEASPQALLQAMETPPVFADCKLIELHSIAWDALSEKEWNAWEDAFSASDAATDTLCLIYAESTELDGGTERAPSKTLQRLGAFATPVRFPKQTELQLSKWIFRHFQAEQLQISSECCHQILDFCGHDMTFLATEIDKMVSYLKSQGRDNLTEADIPYLCAYRPERDAFDFTNAILDGTTAKAFELFAELKARKERPEIILGSISRIFCDLAKIRLLCDAGVSQKELESRMKMHAYRLSLYQKQALRRSSATLQNAVRLCAQTDLKMKSAATDPYLLLERLIVEVSVRSAV